MGVAMNYRILVVAIGSALGLSACVSQVHNLVPDRLVSAGRLQRASDGSGTLEIDYSGKKYTGEFIVQSTRRIEGVHQRYPGRIAHPILVAPDGDKLTCDVQWPDVGKPIVVCKDTMEASFAIGVD